ncbi:hypothetical protein E3U43_007528 [Larimichthys crocea]|uniref:Uncharacterized protein n=1 Tax=Larimichthys crocea TaxID=215358 RepID=A0ACD3Q622_LARCR|nr:hypothetical protein E3U43_007528 [Larimichthys crocea]
MVEEVLRAKTLKTSQYSDEKIQMYQHRNILKVDGAAELKPRDGGRFVADIRLYLSGLHT